MNLANIYTLNRPVIYIDHNKKYRPGDDIIDLPISDNAYSTYKVNSKLASDKFYDEIVLGQKELMKSPATHSTPKSIIIFDNESGKYVKALIKKII